MVTIAATSATIPPVAHQAMQSPVALQTYFVTANLTTVPESIAFLRAVGVELLHQNVVGTDAYFRSLRDLSATSYANDIKQHLVEAAFQLGRIR